MTRAAARRLARKAPGLVVVRISGPAGVSYSAALETWAANLLRELPDMVTVDWPRDWKPRQATKEQR